MSRTKVLTLGSDIIIIVNTCSSFNKRFIQFLVLAVFLDSSFQCLVNRLSSCVYRDKILFNATFKGQTVLTGVPGARGSLSFNEYAGVFTVNVNRTLSC